MNTTLEVIVSEERRRQHNPRFLSRSGDGKARVRMTFTEAEAAQMEEAAGKDDVVKRMHRWLQEGARRDLAAQRRTTPIAPPPEGA